MPLRISAETKREALAILQIHDDISLAHSLTGVNRRTLRRWRKELGRRQNRFLSEKTFLSDRKRTENAISEENSQSGPQVDSPSDDQVDLTAAGDYENLTHIRGKLMGYARQVADGLGPDQADSNSRTLALSRVLDRIQLIDQTLPELQPKERPPWQDAYDALLELDIRPYDLIQVEESANQLDDSLRARVYEYYREYHAERLREEKQGSRFW